MGLINAGVPDAPENIFVSGYSFVKCAVEPI